MHRKAKIFVITLLGMIAFAERSAMAQTTETFFSPRLSHTYWYMGNSPLGVQLDTENKPQLLENKKQPFGGNGAAVATDPASGKLLFYTDGAWIYDTNHVQANTVALPGNVALAQPAAICPKPGSAGVYYIFLHTAGNTIQYVEYNTSTGAISPLQNVVPVAGEAMAIIPHDNGTDYYLIYQQTANSNRLTMALVTASGVQSPTDITLSGIDNFTAFSFTYHSDTKRLGVVPATPGVDAFTATVDNTGNGNITSPSSLASSSKSTTAQSIASVSFSPTGSYAFVALRSTASTGADILRYPVAGGPSASVKGSTTMAEVYDLSLASDGKIYTLYKETAGGGVLMGSIANPEGGYAFTSDLFQGKDFVANRFPSFLPDVKITATVDFDNTSACQGSPTVFFPNTTPTADKVEWNLPGGVQGWSVVAKLPSTQNVTMTAFYGTKQVSVTKSVSVKSFDLKVKLPADTSACSCELLRPIAKGIAPCDRFKLRIKASGTQPSSVRWSTGETGLEIEPEEAGFYYAVASDGSGCSTLISSQVKEYGYSKQIQNAWYFGNRAIADFNPTTQLPAPAPKTSQMNAPEGANAVSDFNGKVIFYTDGKKVWDKEGGEVSADIGGDADATQVEVFRVPNDTTLFYIITPKKSTAGNRREMRYSLFDLRATNPRNNNTLGDLVKTNQLLYESSTEQVHYNEKSGWLVGHEYDNALFRAYPVSKDGVGNPIVSNVGSVLTETMGEGQLKLNRAADTLGIAIPATNANYIELFKFDKGSMKLYHKINLNDVDGKIYGLEFSPGGSKVFATLTKPGGSKLYEYAVRDPATKIPALSGARPSSRNLELGSINYGPDGGIYVAVKGANAIGSIGSLETRDSSGKNYTNVPSSFNQNGKQLNTGTGGLGLNTFLYNTSIGTGEPSQVPISPVCLGKESLFNFAKSDQIDQISWDFGDPEKLNADKTKSTNIFPVFSMEATASYKYPAKGTYATTIYLKNRCITKQGCNFLENGAPPAGAQCLTSTNPDDKQYFVYKANAVVSDQVKIPTVPNAEFCKSTTVEINAKPANPQAAYDYEWYNNKAEFNQGAQPFSRNPSITATAPLGGDPAPRVYFLVVKLPGFNTECFYQQEIVLADNRPLLNLPTNLPTCQLLELPPLNPDPNNANPAVNYEWTIDGMSAGAEKMQKIDTSNPGIFTYAVKATIANVLPQRQCVNTDTTFVKIIASPTIATTIFNATDCYTPNGEIQLSITNYKTSVGPYKYDISSDGLPVSRSAANLRMGTYTETGLGAGTYIIRVTDLVTGCEIPKSIALSSPNRFDFGYELLGPNCDSVQIKVTSIPNTLVLTRFNITQFNTGKIWDRKSIQPLANTFTSSQKLPRGEYQIEVKDINDCIVIKTITLNPDIKPNLSIGQNCLSLVASGATNLTWTANVPSAIVGENTGQTIRMKPGAGVVTYTATAINGGCVASAQKVINVPHELNPVIEQTDPCKETISLSANPRGPTYTYRWFREGIYQPGNEFSGPDISLGLADDGGKWKIELFDIATSCLNFSEEKEAMIAGNVDIAINSSTACQGNKFTITATSAANPTQLLWYHNGELIASTDVGTLEAILGGTYKVTASKRGCNVSAETSVTPLENPISKLSRRVIICNDPSNTDPDTYRAELNPGGNYAAYEWFKDGTPLNYFSPTYVADQAGVYTVQMTSREGCKGTGKVEVLQDCPPKITAPNAFKPSSLENLNRQFSVFAFYIDPEQFQIIIYNRWGEAVFSSNKKDFRWNGGYDNNAERPVPNGNYVYVIRYIAKYRPEQGVQEFRGSVSVLR